MEGRFYGIYMKHTPNKHDELDEENQRKREALKKGRSQHTGYGEKLNWK